MDHQFWHDRWEEGKLGFHEGRVNALLEIHAGKLPPPPSRIFLPLCGKTADIGWLLAQGHRVAGAELSEIAIANLFLDLRMTPQISDARALRHYSAPGLDIFVGDIFELTLDALGPVDAVYDRAALVALPETMRGDYARHLTGITARAAQLLITFTYDQSVMPGPPFSISAEEVSTRYRDVCEIHAIETRDVAGGLKGIAPATETIWHLVPRA